MSANVELDSVWVKFGPFVAARDINVNIEGGEFFSFLGPSGCGKTTILRCVSGFLEPSEGRVSIGGQNMAGIGPNKRPTALIFQNLALFPLMSVWENIAFALEVRGVSKAQRRKRADELLDLIALPGQGHKMCSELSGGQRQRVAIARALCAEPQVLLLDEPLSALDLKLRQHMRSELREIQQRVGITFIYITHDQGEALIMSDHVAVMSEGVIQQVADGNTLYDHPITPFTASFVGENNPFEGCVESVDSDFAVIDTSGGRIRARVAQGAEPLKVGDKSIVFVRPEALKMVNGDAATWDNTISGNVMQEEFEGSLWHVTLSGHGGSPIRMSVINERQQLGHAAGDAMTVGFRADMAVALPHGPMASE